MNIVTAYLLLFCEEEESFYLLCAIIQRIPQYYTSEMTGTLFPQSSEVVLSRNEAGSIRVLRGVAAPVHHAV